MGDPCNTAAINQVKIESVNDSAVTFSTRSASHTGDPQECLLRSYTVSRSEVHTEPMQGMPPSVPLIKGKVGPLYLSRVGWNAVSADGYQLHGREHVQFKLPNCAAAAARLLTRLRVIPTSIVVRGHIQGTTEFFDLELCGDEAAPSQSIRWTGADFVDVRLTSQGARGRGLKPSATTVKIWPVSIRITGSPAIDQAVSGDVDILDLEMADTIQSLAYAKLGQPIELALTQDGVNAFHLTPQVVAELSVGARRAAAPCAGCAEQVAQRSSKRPSGATRRPRPRV
jgi:hypothetical protein